MEKHHFNFYNKIINGQKKRKPLWKRGFHFVDSLASEAISRIYIENNLIYFRKIKSEITELTTLMKKSFEKRLINLPWMTSKTKKYAIKKLHALQFKLVFPTKWENNLNNNNFIKKLSSTHYVKNCLVCSELYNNIYIEKENRNYEPSSWHDISPHIVNAYYIPTHNEVIIPAAILQPPFYSNKTVSNVDIWWAKTLGSIGATIGHEMTHAFDDEGSKYDKDGNIYDWWTKEDTQKFKIHCKSIEKQYSSFEVLKGKYLNGKLTCGENIADMGGIMIAQDTLLEKYKTKEIQDKLLKIFYEEYAISWCGKLRKEYMRELLLTDPHSSYKFRVNGVLSRIPEFQRIYQINKNDNMYFPEKITIW